MALEPGRRYRGRFVHVAEDGTVVYAMGCGRTVCDADAYLEGRHIHIADDGTPLYAVASDGCQPPLDLADGLAQLDETCVTEATVRTELATEPYFVEAANFPPNGLSRVLRAEFRAATGCADLDCVGAYLIYHEPGDIAVPAPCSNDPANGVWYGCIQGIDGPLPIHVYYDPTAAAGLRYQACLGGDATACRSPVEAVLDTTGASSCGGLSQFTAPVDASSTVMGGTTYCCECPLGQISMKVRSFCRPYRVARLIGKDGGGNDLYGIADCVAPTCEPTTNCCAILSTCPLNLGIVVEPGTCCDDLTGDWGLNPNPSGSGNWSTFSGGGILIPACGLSFTFLLSCTDNNQMELTGTVSMPGASCSGTATATVDPCWPLEVVFNLVLTCSFAGPHAGHCTPITITATVTA